MSEEERQRRRARLEERIHTLRGRLLELEHNRADDGRRSIREVAILAIKTSLSETARELHRLNRPLQ